MAILSILLTLENVFTHPPSLSSQPSTVANNDETGKIETAVTEVAPFATFQYPDTTTTNIKDTPLENNQHEQELAQYNQLMRDIFEMLIIAIRENEASRKFLIEQIGIHTIQDSIKLSGILSTKYCKTAFGGMFGLALESIEVTDLFEEGGNVGRQLLSNRNTTLVSAGFLLNIIKLIPLCSKISPESVIGAILALSHANKHNQVQIYNSGALFTLFSWLFNNNESWILASCANDEVKLASHPSYKIIKELTNRLIEVGISNVELRHLFQRFDISHFRPDEKTNVRLMEVILHGLSRGRSPAYFSMALDRHCSIWMNDFGRTFPPQGGYTFMMWFQVEKFDTTAPDDGQSLKKPNIPIFGIVDDEERIRLNISLDSIQQQLHIQTYKAEVSVSGFKFEQGEWYHIAIVHQKPRISASYADVFVNGTMIEHTRCPYLGHPGSAKHVRSYFGYPPDQKINGNQTSILNIGSAYFIEEILFEAKEVSSIYYLGFDYYSNFQGSLTKYRTNESMHQILVDGGRFNDAQRENNPGDMTMLSMILPFQMSSNSSFLPEDKVLVAIHPHNHLGVVLNDYSNESNSTLYQTAAKFASLKAVFNSSIPKLKDESEVVSTLANIKGNVLVVCPERLIDGLWKIGGCSILLKLIETSQVRRVMKQHKIKTNPFRFFGSQVTRCT